MYLCGHVLAIVWWPLERMPLDVVLHRSKIPFLQGFASSEGQDDVRAPWPNISNPLNVSVTIVSHSPIDS